MSNSGHLSLVCFFLDVMSPWVESVYSGHITLCKTAYWEGKKRLERELFNLPYCHLCWSLSFPHQNDAEKVVVVIMDKEHHPVERFVFEISQPPLLSIRFFSHCFSKEMNVSLFCYVVVFNSFFVFAALTHYCLTWSSCLGHLSWRSVCVMPF